MTFLLLSTTVRALRPLLLDDYFNNQPALKLQPHF